MTKDHDTRPAKDEINSTVQSMMIGAYIVGAIIIGASLLEARNDSRELMRISFLCAISLSFLVAQGDHRVFRLGKWVEKAEADPQGTPGWEYYKARLKSRKVVMPIVDIGMATAPLYVISKMGWQVYSLDPVFFAGALVALVFGIIMIPVAQALAGW